MKIILGSSSPRRKQILSEILHIFDTYSPDINENIRKSESPIIYANRISKEKKNENFLTNVFFR